MAQGAAEEPRLVVLTRVRAVDHVLTAPGLRSKSCNSPFIGERLAGSVRLTMAGGRLVHRTEPRG